MFLSANLVFLRLWDIWLLEWSYQKSFYWYESHVLNSHSAISFFVLFENLHFRTWQDAWWGFAAGLSPLFPSLLVQHTFHCKTSPYRYFAYAKMLLFFLVPNNIFRNLWIHGDSCPWSSTGASPGTHLCSVPRVFSLVVHHIQLSLWQFCPWLVSEWMCASTCLWSWGINLACEN